MVEKTTELLLKYVNPDHDKEFCENQSEQFGWDGYHVEDAVGFASRYRSGLLRLCADHLSDQDELQKTARGDAERGLEVLGYNSLIAPSALYKPRLFLDGDKWCALYGENLQDGVAGFGESPYKAFMAFDKAWYEHTKVSDHSNKGEV